VVYSGFYRNAGNYYDCGHGRSLPDAEKMIPRLAALLEAFTTGAVLAVSVFLLWKKKDHE